MMIINNLRKFLQYHFIIKSLAKNAIQRIKRNSLVMLSFKKTLTIKIHN
jgi:hypothetical protein